MGSKSFFDKLLKLERNAIDLIVINLLDSSGYKNRDINN